MSNTGDQWLYVAAPLFAYGIVVLGLAAWGWGGDPDQERGNFVATFFRSISFTLHKMTGLPGWCMAGGLTGLVSAGIAAFGLYWDVAWHIDNGRDKELFTPSHTLILIGLNGLVFAAGIAILFATLDRTGSGGGVRGLRIPWSALVLGALGLGASAAFPLDDLWHKTYGVDVTLWSPTHLQLISGGGLSPLALWLMIREGRREAGAAPNLLGRGIEVLSFGAILTGLSVYQGEFDFGVPQFQVMYQPLLISIAAGLALVAARAALGAGGALLATLAFLVLRVVVVLLVSGALNHTVPRFPLYLAAAVGVEVVAWALGTEARVRFALVSGAVVATLGVGAELAWIQLSGWGSVALNGLPLALLLCVVAASAASLLGVALVQGAVPPGSGARAGAGPEPRVQPLLLVVAGLALVGVLAVPLDRNVGDVQAVIGLDRLDGEATVTVQLEPAPAAEDATLFGILAWQGGGRVEAELDRVGPGRYVSSRPIPVGGDWKSMVALQRGDEVMAAPIYLPADPEIGATAVPALPERRVAFSLNTDILLREGKDGPALPALLAYGGVTVVLAIWLALFARAASRVRPRPSSRGGGRIGGIGVEPA